MKTGTLWIIRLALTVQILGVLSVPVLVAEPEFPRRAVSTIERAIDTFMGGR